MRGVFALLKLTWAIFAFTIALAFRPDDPAPGDDDGKTGDDGKTDDDGKPKGDTSDDGKPKDDDDGKPYKTLTFKTEQDWQNWNDKFYTSNRKKFLKIAREELEEDLRDEIGAEYEEDVDKAKGAAERRKTKIANLESQLDEKDQRITELEDQITGEKKNAKKYADVIEQRWQKIAERVPEHITEIIGDRDVLYRLDYIERHPDVLIEKTDDDSQNDDDQQQQQQQPDAQHRVIGSPPTPQHQRQQPQESDEDREALETTNRQIQHSL